MEKIFFYVTTPAGFGFSAICIEQNGEKKYIDLHSQNRISDQPSTISLSKIRRLRTLNLLLNVFYSKKGEPFINCCVDANVYRKLSLWTGKMHPRSESFKNKPVAMILKVRDGEFAK